MNDDYSILIGGAAGLGSRKAGLMLAKLFSEFGYRIFIYDDYQSLIRGGHSFSNIRVSAKEVLSHKKDIDFLLALDKETIEKHQKELKKAGLIVYNSSCFSLKNKNAVGVPTEEIVAKFGGSRIMGNTAVIAGFAKIIGIDWATVENILKRELKKFQDINIKIARFSFERNKKLFNLRRLNRKPMPLLTGNEAVALGAAKAGLDLYIAYPMTPATGILHYFASQESRLKVKTFQLENEVGIANAALGAAYAGARTMVGTSGGGFALMTEAFSSAAQGEIPMVIVESQRMSPGTGVATYQGQGDLSFVLGAGHGDIVRFVVAPGDADEACFWAGKILNLAWKFQTPSVLLIDKEISESTFSFDERILKRIKPERPLLWNGKGKYLRYKKTKSGISPLAFPGNKKAVVKSNSYEHDEFGITVEDKKEVEEMQNKRLRKFKKMKEEVEKLPAVNIFGSKASKKAIIVWGSTKGPAKEAAEELKIKMIQPIVIEPFPERQMKTALKGVKEIVLAETNGLGQMEKILNCYNIKADKKILKYNARPFTAEEIKEKLI